MNTGRIITALATILAIPAMAADAPGYFKVPGTDTTLKIYGFVQADGVYDIDGNYGMDTGMYASGFDTKKTSDDGVWHESTALENQWNWRAKGRFGFTTTTPSSLGDVVVKMEFQAVDNGDNKVAMRHCFGKIGGLTIGKTDSIFADWDASANYMDNDGPLYDFYGNGRVNQISYAFSPAEGWNIAFGLEQNKNGATDKGFDTNSLVAAAGYSGDWGHVRASVAYQKCKIDSVDAADAVYGLANDDNGDGTWSLDDSINVIPTWHVVTAATPAYGSDSKSVVSWGLGANYVVGKGNITAQVFDGVGFYGADGGDKFYTSDTNELAYQRAFCWNIGYSHAVTDSVTIAGGVGQTKWKEDKDVFGTTATLTNYFMNCQWQATKQASFGIEYFYGSMKLDDGFFKTEDGGSDDTAKESRINLRAKFQLF
jgi:hypothetical protein